LEIDILSINTVGFITDSRNDEALREFEVRQYLSNTEICMQSGYYQHGKL